MSLLTLGTRSSCCHGHDSERNCQGGDPCLWEDIPGMKRCQEWTSELINDLVKEGVLPKSALEVLDTARTERSMPHVA